MKNLFDLAAERHSIIVKQAFFGSLAGSLIGSAAKSIALPVAGYAVKNPLKTLGAAFTTAEVAGAARNAQANAGAARSRIFNLSNSTQNLNPSTM